MSDLLLGTLSLLLATNRPAVVSNIVTGSVTRWAEFATGTTVDPNDPVEREFRELMEADDAADHEIERIVTDGPELDPTQPKDAKTIREAGRLQTLEQINKLRARYDAFVQAHPQHVRGRLAFADFFENYGEDSEAIEQLRIALDIDPKNAPGWNNYAGLCAHSGEITNAFQAFEKAIQLRPFEPLYHYNFGTVVFLYRKDAREYFHCDETAVFEKALSLYQETRRLAPRNFRYAFDYAQTYYGVKVPPTETPGEQQVAKLKLNARALAAWEEALQLANNETDRQGIFLHMARWHIMARRWDAAREQIAKATLPELADLKRRLERSLIYREAEPEVPEVPGSLTPPNLQR